MHGHWKFALVAKYSNLMLVLHDCSTNCLCTQTCSEPLVKNITYRKELIIIRMDRSLDKGLMDWCKKGLIPIVHQNETSFKVSQLTYTCTYRDYYYFSTAQCNDELIFAKLISS